MFFFCVTKYYHVVQVNDTVSQVQLSQGVLHKMLEHCGHVAQSKGHSCEFVKTQVADHEHGILLRLLGHADLPKSTLEVHSGEVCSSSHALQCLLYPGEGVGIFLSLCIESSESNTELEGPILFLHQHHGIAPRRLTRPNGASLQHIS